MTRLSTNYIFNNSLNGVTNARASLVDMYEQISSGKQVRKASDDPVQAARILDFQRTVADIEQSERFVAISRNELEIEESVLTQVQDSGMRARTLIVQARNGTMNADNRAVIATEIDEIIEQMAMLSNTKNSDGSFIFSGYESDFEAFSFVRDAAGQITSATYEGDNNTIVKTVSPSIKVETSHPGSEVFDSGTVSIFQELIDARNQMNAGLPPSNLDALDDALDMITIARSDVGARMNKVDSASELNVLLGSTIETNLAKIRDLDLPTAITKFTQLEVTVQAISNTFAKVSQLSLFNYLR